MMEHPNSCAVTAATGAVTVPTHLHAMTAAIGDAVLPRLAVCFKAGEVRVWAVQT